MGALARPFIPLLINPSGLPEVTAETWLLSEVSGDRASAAGGFSLKIKVETAIPKLKKRKKKKKKKKKERGVGGGGGGLVSGLLYEEVFCVLMSSPPPPPPPTPVPFSLLYIYIRLHFKNGERERKKKGEEGEKKGGGGGRRV